MELGGLCSQIGLRVQSAQSSFRRVKEVAGLRKRLRVASRLIILILFQILNLSLLSLLLCRLLNKGMALSGILALVNLIVLDLRNDIVLQQVQIFLMLKDDLSLNLFRITIILAV